MHNHRPPSPPRAAGHVGGACLPACLRALCSCSARPCVKRVRSMQHASFVLTLTGPLPLVSSRATALPGTWSVDDIPSPPAIRVPCHVPVSRKFLVFELGTAAAGWCSGSFVEVVVLAGRFYASPQQRSAACPRLCSIWSEWRLEKCSSRCGVVCVGTETAFLSPYCTATCYVSDSAQSVGEMKAPRPPNVGIVSYQAHTCGHGIK